MIRWRAFLRGTASLLDLQGALAREPKLRDLRREFPDWDITGSNREGFTAEYRTKNTPEIKGGER